MRECGARRRLIENLARFPPIGIFSLPLCNRLQAQQGMAAHDNRRGGAI
jgi:hypothetical protein